MKDVVDVRWEDVTHGSALILEERIRQMTDEDWSETHDDSHVNGELAQAAQCYWECAINPEAAARIYNGVHRLTWPWDMDWFKPWSDSAGDPEDRPVNEFRCAVKAGALFRAERDRLKRLEEMVARHLTRTA